MVSCQGWGVTGLHYSDQFAAPETLTRPRKNQLTGNESASAFGGAARWHLGGGRQGGRRTLEERRAAAALSDETFAALEAGDTRKSNAL